jgi:hypothetical protein
MGILLKLILLISLSISSVLTQIPPNSVPIATADSAVSASYSVYYEFIEPKCVDSTSGIGNNIGQYPIGQSIENFIALIEKLEYAIQNSSQSGYEKIKGAEQMARVLLRRFRFDGFDETVQNSYKNPRDKLLDDINNAFLGFPDIDHNYYFPDYVYTEEERCSMFYMLSHNIINTTQTRRRLGFSPFGGRIKRQSYQYNQNSQYNRRQYNPTANPQFPVPVASHFLNTRNASIIKEEGVVSFRAHKTEAIAPARVLLGIIAALAQNVKTQVKDIVGRDVGDDKTIDPLLAMTLADLWGSGTTRPSDEKTYFYGVNGEWTSTACTSYYGLTSVPADKVVRFNKGTKAEIRGGIDGYLIGKSLFKLGMDVRSRLKLSTILRSYYSKPKVSKNGPLSISYCDRNSIQQSISELTNTAQLYWVIQAYKSGGPINPNLPPEFSSALSSAQSPESGGDYCTSMSSALDKGSPCETPSDVIFIIDGQSSDKLQQSGEIVAAVSGILTNIRAKGGAVSIFLNSQQKSNNPDVILPIGPGDWPLGTAAFNSTSYGCASCRVNDFKSTPPQPVANTGKLFQYLNQTLFNYEWWTPRTNDSAIPAKSVVLIDLGSVPAAPDSGQDRNDYNNYKDQLRYRHRDVKYLSAATNQDLFKDILRDENDKANPGPPGTTVQFGSDFAKKICENPATFQYNRCHERRSENVQSVGYVTPGYKQNWAMYPEFFLKSFDITFNFKAEDGEIKICYDRYFPPEKLDYCKELKQGESYDFKISNPCKDKSFQSCNPFYFTVWGKDRTPNTYCLDEGCASLDQIKFTVTHTGVSCNSSKHLLPSTSFQAIALLIFAILYLFLTNNKS